MPPLMKKFVISCFNYFDGCSKEKRNNYEKMDSNCGLFMAF